MDKTSPGIALKKYRKHLAALVFVIGVAIHAMAFVLPANSDMIDGRHALHMDEWIIYDQMKPFTEVRNAADLYNAYVGTDHRYGRLIYLLPAPAAAMAYHAYGESGLIVTVRMFFFTAIVALAAMTFLISGRSVIGALAGLSILLLPFSDYYATTPKPDVLQVIALLIVFLLLARNKLLWAGFALGVAVGFKLSSLIALPIIALAYAQTIAATSQNAFVQNMRNASTRAKLSVRSGVKNLSLWSGLFFAGFILNVPIVLASSNGWQVYKAWTLGQMAHGQNQDRFLFFDWWVQVPALSGGVLNATVLIGLLFACLLICVTPQLKAARAAYQNTQGDTQRKLLAAGAGLFINRVTPAALIAALAVAWILAITLFTPRIWGFYLWPSFALAVIGAAYWLADQESATVRVPKLLLGAGLCVFIVGFPSSNLTQRYEQMSQRTQSEAYLDYERKHVHVEQFLKIITAPSQQIIHFDPRLFQPVSTATYRIINYWGPYRDWALRPLAVIAIDNSFAFSPNPINKYQIDMNKAYPLALKHRAKPHGQCIGKGCYHIWTEADGLQIWVRK